MIVTIDILPQQGWHVDEWVGPVFNIDGTTAQIEMDSSQAVAVRLKLATPRTAIATPEARFTEEKSSQLTSIPRLTAKEPATVGLAVNRAKWHSNEADKALQLRHPAPTPTRRPPPTPGASSYYNKGIDYYDDGKYQLAVNEFTTAIRLNPSFTNAYFNRGNAYYELDQYGRVVQDFNKVIQLDPNYAAAYHNRGNAYRNLGEYTQADADKSKACSLNSKYC